jgi:hypothetical protein
LPVKIGSSGFVFSSAALRLTKRGDATFDREVEGVSPFLLAEVALLQQVRPRTDRKKKMEVYRWLSMLAGQILKGVFPQLIGKTPLLRRIAQD